MNEGAVAPLDLVRMTTTPKATMTDTSLIPTIEALRGLIANYSSRPGRVNESNTIRALVTPMISALGWKIDDLDEVQSEYRHVPADNPVDYALFLNGSPSLFVEAKALDEKLDDRKWIIQTLNYANNCNVEWAVLTNGAEWRVYNVHAKAEAENKLFYTVDICGSDPREAARRLSMLAKQSMAPRRALDQAWQEAAVDRAMRKVIETLPDNPAAIRAMAEASDGLSEKDVRDALRRLGLRADWRDEDDLFPVAPVAIAQAVTVANDVASTAPLVASSNSPSANVASLKWQDIKFQHLLASGALRLGGTLRLRDRPGSEAQIESDKLCNFRGELMTFSRWGMAVTGWTAIQIYKHAETEEGVLLQDLREALIGG